MGSRSVILCLFLLGLSSLAAYGVEMRSARPVWQERPPPLAALVGESLVYDISFLWFDRLAEGRLSLDAGDPPRTYRAVLEAKTLGIAAWLTGDRVQRYVSVMEIGPDGRLRPLSFEFRIIKGRAGSYSNLSRLYLFDYSRRLIRLQRSINDVFETEEQLPMAGATPPSDILSAFYNVRAGLLGPLKTGRNYFIPTFGRSGDEAIRIELLNEKQWPDEPFFPRPGLLGRAVVDDELFDTRGGRVYVWFDDLGRPQRGMVENVIGIGSVRGKLRSLVIDNIDKEKDP
jgi:hypothetical protein